MSTNDLVKKYWPQYCRVERIIDSPPLVPLSADDANDLISEEFDRIEEKIASDLYDTIIRNEESLDWWLRVELADVHSIEKSVIWWLKTKYHVTDEVVVRGLVKTWNKIHE